MCNINSLADVSMFIVTGDKGSWWVDAIHPETGAQIVAYGERVKWQDDQGNWWKGTVSDEAVGRDDDMFELKNVLPINQ